MRDLKTNTAETKAARQNLFKRWRWRFSLRSLLIACTLFALLLGAFMYRVRTQKQAVAEICKLYGHVTYEPNWLGHILHESIEKYLDKDFYANVVSVSLRSQTVNHRMVTPTDAEFGQLVDAISRLRHVTTLNLSLQDDVIRLTLGLQDDDIARLAPLRCKIESLLIDERFQGDLRGNKLESPNLQPLASLSNLTHLTLGQGTLNESVFADISKIESLQTLSLFACRFDGEYLLQLQKLPNFTGFHLHNICVKTKYESYTMDESGNYQPLGNPIFRFEAETTFRRTGNVQSTSPDCWQWLKKILPRVQVTSMYFS